MLTPCHCLWLRTTDFSLLSQLYEKYNAVLRANGDTYHLVTKFNELCVGNKYVTTIHCINS